MAHIKAELLILLVALGQGQRGGTSYKVGLPVVMEVLSRAQVSGSLEYWGTCADGLDLPKLQSPQRIEDDPVEALRKIFANNPNMEVRKGSTGMIRMVERDVPQDLLAVKIRRIPFGTAEPRELLTYDPRGALQVILSTPEIVAFMKEHDIGPPYGLQDGSRTQSQPSPNDPHISGNLDNVTLSEALDYVLRTFPGLWIYENCPSRIRARGVVFVFYQNGPVWPLAWK